MRWALCWSIPALVTIVDDQYAGYGQADIVRFLNDFPRLINTSYAAQLPTKLRPQFRSQCQVSSSLPAVTLSGRPFTTRRVAACNHNTISLAPIRPWSWTTT